MTKNIDHSPLSKSILKTLLYFDIFQYPLTISEIFAHLTTNHVTSDHVATELKRLSGLSIIYPVSGFISLHNSSLLGNRRIKGNQMAQQDGVFASGYIRNSR